MCKDQIECYDTYNKKWIGNQTGTLSSNSCLTGCGVFLAGIPINESLQIKSLGVLRNVRSDYGKQTRKEYEAGGNSNLYSVEIAKGGIVDTDMGNTIDDGKKDGLFVEISPKLTVYAVWYPKKQCYIAIRKLTPKECFRLQGWSDEYFEKAQFVNSDSQLYKQAGNGVTVSVVYEIAKRLKEGESNAKENDGTDQVFGKAEHKEVP